DSTMIKSATDQFEAFPVEVLRERATAKSPQVLAIPAGQLAGIAGGILGRKITLARTMSLTARNPFEAAGFMDAYKPGRWDCESNLVFMDVIRQIGPNPGEWDGTVVYARFTTASHGTYLVVGNFSGYQVTMNMHGPWGNNTAYCATTSDHAQAVALWEGTAG